MHGDDNGSAGALPLMHIHHALTLVDNALNVGCAEREQRPAFFIPGRPVLPWKAALDGDRGGPRQGQEPRDCVVSVAHGLK